VFVAIKILPDKVVSQIAAGEVVERPASVVKELLENSLDASSQKIGIRCEKAGQKLIEVADDGMGIPAGELALALARHATSKLSSADDLFSIHTLGFRGEALASIGSVARLTITSRTPTSDLGARLVVEGGQMGDVEKVGVPQGTVVRVEDLFFNIPARLKFLKKAATERRRIDDLVTRYALAYPKVKLHLFHEGQPVFQTNGSGDRREVLSTLYGVDLARQMLEVSLEESGISMSGYISPIALTRSNRHEITFFVNGRWVQDTALAAALIQAYHTLLMVGRYPMAVLFIKVPPETIDVNVHPTKAEIRFRSPDGVFSSVQRAVRRGLMAYSPVPHISNPAWQPATASPGALGWQGESQQIDPAWEMAGELRQVGQADQSAFPSTAPQMGGNHLPVLRVVGQIGAAYLVAEGPDGLYLIDQHAAHERVLFERFQNRDTEAIPSQKLLEAVVFQVSPQNAQMLENNLSLLTQLGYDVEVFGPGAFRVRGVPAFLMGSDPVASVRVIVEDFEEDETPLAEELEARLAARICKRAAVKAGQVLSPEEQKILVRDLEACQSPRTCPHGRPTMIHLSVDLLERQFGRRGSR
jgi:DNA mismatch repair protein MutL